MNLSHFSCTMSYNELDKVLALGLQSKETVFGMNRL